MIIRASKGKPMIMNKPIDPINESITVILPKDTTKNRKATLF